MARPVSRTERRSNVLLSPTIICHEMLLKLDGAPFALRGYQPFAAQIELEVPVYDLTLSLEGFSAKHCSQWVLSFLQNKDYADLPALTDVAAMWCAIDTWKGWQVRVLTMPHPDDKDQYLFRVDCRYSPVKGQIAMPVYLWLGEAAEAFEVA